jgi:hypothetical protein
MQTFDISSFVGLSQSDQSPDLFHVHSLCRMKRKEHHSPAEEPVARRTRRKVAANSVLEPEKRSSTIYTYASLQDGHICLLGLGPKKPWESLSGNLIHCPLIDAPEFVAPSYVWGSDQTPYYLETSQGKLPLTKSLKSALQKLQQTLGNQNKEDHLAFWMTQFASILINLKRNATES